MSSENVSVATFYTRYPGEPAFQRLWNRFNSSDRIAEDGDCGAATLARLNQSPIVGFGETNTTRILRLSQPFMEGDDVRKIQEALVKANITVAVDGIFGTDTENALKQFQQQARFRTRWYCRDSNPFRTGIVNSFHQRGNR